MAPATAYLARQLSLFWPGPVLAGADRLALARRDPRGYAGRYLDDGAARPGGNLPGAWLACHSPHRALHDRRRAADDKALFPHGVLPPAAHNPAPGTAACRRLAAVRDSMPR